LAAAFEVISGKGKRMVDRGQQQRAVRIQPLASGLEALVGFLFPVACSDGLKALQAAKVLSECLSRRHRDAGARSTFNRVVDPLKAVHQVVVGIADAELQI
jgi:hypothetical protein